MEVVIAVVVAVVVGLICGLLWEHSKSSGMISKVVAERDAQTKYAERLTVELERVRAENKENLRHQQEEMDRHNKERMEAMKAEFHALAHEVLDAETRKLKENGEDQLQQVVKPLKDHLDSLGKVIQDANEKGISNKTSFEESMRRLAEQTANISAQTENLTHALKGESKTQGDWGEMILDSILEHSGLRRDQEYFLQENVKTKTGNNLRPDVVVKFPDKREVIIDSKVSLTAYMDYINAVDMSSQNDAVKLHIASVRKHVDELAQKDYSSLIKNADNYVLMFLQSDAAYILAVKNDANLNEYAFSKHVIITCPTTLMMTLQIIYNIWQSDKQNKNVEKIVSKATSLYDKFVGFTATFSEIDKNLRKASDAYDKSLKQLSEGRGNIVSRLDDIRALGLNPQKDFSEDLKERAGLNSSECEDERQE
ncbi:MAG: DNA recombination protein RmuC [Bacteroidaceae bacterium]|jgi:DNA recombination protein RmuC|nr:DNA recombination protein RmuC [Bacteroidaceae bacterium]